MSKHFVLPLILTLVALPALVTCSVAPMMAPAPLVPAADPAVTPSTPTRAPTPTTRVATPLPTSTPRPVDITSLVLARAHVPILCYHHIRDWDANEAEVDKPYIVPPALFAAQMDFLDQHGYHPITPHQPVDYLNSSK